MIKPCGHYVLIKPQEIEEVDEVYKIAKNMGLQLADKNQRELQTTVSRGVVLAVGQSAWRDYADGTPWCKEGDLVAYVRHGGMYVKDVETEEDFLLLNDGDVVAILKSKE